MSFAYGRGSGRNRDQADVTPCDLFIGWFES